MLASCWPLINLQENVSERRGEERRGEERRGEGRTDEEGDNMLRSTRGGDSSEEREAKERNVLRWESTYCVFISFCFEHWNHHHFSSRKGGRGEYLCNRRVREIT